MGPSPKKQIRTAEVQAQPDVCRHLKKESCMRCQERFCVACDPYHRENCADANRA